MCLVEEKEGLQIGIFSTLIKELCMMALFKRSSRATLLSFNSCHCLTGWQSEGCLLDRDVDGNYGAGEASGVCSGNRQAGVEIVASFLI